MTQAAPPWLAEALPEWVRDYLAPPPAERARYFAAGLERAAGTGTVVSADGAVLGIEPMEWDTRHFGIPCARLAPICIRPSASLAEQGATLAHLVDQALRWCRGHGVRFLLRRMVAARSAEAAIFEARGFRLVDAIVTLTAAADGAPGNGICPLAERDLPALRRIVGEAFTHSRFLADRRLDPIKAGQVYVHWLDGLATGTGSGEKPGVGAAVLVARDGDDAAGFIALRCDPTQDSVFGERLAFIELFAVATASRGRGHGARLLAAAKSWARAVGASLVEASTWAASAAALRSYRGAGFEMRDTLLSFHCHLD
jgi:GNAT superfamily N-acetyltransferase